MRVELRCLVAAAAVAAAVTLAGCDADTLEQNDDVAPQPDVVRSGLVTLYSGVDAEVAPEAACFADALTTRLTLDELVAAGIVMDDGTVTETTPMLTLDVAGAWVDAAASCAPYAVVAARAAAVRTPGLDQVAYAGCLTDAIAPDRLRTALVATLAGRFGTEPAVAELTAAQDGCAAEQTALG